MAGLFGMFNYQKEGPGIDKDAPPEPRIVVFFRVIGRKFWNLISINLLYFVFNIPAIPAMMAVMMFAFPAEISGDALLDILIRFALGTFLLCVPVIAVGPAQSGLTYILRNYSNEEHAFIWMDFKDAAKKNLKQSLLISAIDFLIVIALCIAVNFYLRFPDGGTIMKIIAGFVIMAFILFMMMHIYIYPMLVTFNLKLKDIYKNALIFAVMKFIPNLGILAVCFLLSAAVFFLNTVAGFVFYILIAGSITGLIMNFYSNPVLVKYLSSEEDKKEPASDI
ncbi:MAG: DUF624 domain-containing protein [Eubacteriales bacterium]|nr:DUF624 domain-containing protein [Eubacteriales bacterium]